MNVIQKLQLLTDKEKGAGISLATIARFSNCHPTTLGKYLKGLSVPTQRLEQLIDNGIDNIIALCEEIKNN